MDLIIGVLYHRNFQIVADFARKNKISIINPISERTDILKDNPFVFKIQPATSTQPQILAKYLKSYTADGKVLIVRNGQYPDRRFPDQVLAACRELNIDARIVEGQQAMISQLSQDAENFVIAYSTKTEYVADFTRRLYELRNNFRINLIGLPEWQTLNGIETEYLSVLRTHAMLPGFIDYQNPWVNSFVADYQSRYFMDPPFLAFQGYDAAWYFLSALNRYGTGFARCLDEMDEKCLLTRYKFKTSEGIGYENQRWMIYRFEGYRLVPEFVY
jgi:ABC-type branched-subunit amino acid transport system substrate-binding protein